MSEEKASQPLVRSLSEKAGGRNYEAGSVSQGRYRFDEDVASDEDVRAVVSGAAKTFREILEKAK
jgi:hypothetical protein